MTVSVVLLLVGTLTLTLDQAAKTVLLRWPRARITLRLVRIVPVFVCTPLFRAMRNPWALLTLWLADTIVLIGLVQYVPLLHTTLASVAIGAAIGGAASNVLDRLCRAGIVDYIDVRIWPVFNLADLAIVGGGVIACGAFFSGLAR